MRFELVVLGILSTQVDDEIRLCADVENLFQPFSVTNDNPRVQNIMHFHIRSSLKSQYFLFGAQDIWSDFD